MAYKVARRSGVLQYRRFSLAESRNWRHGGICWFCKFTQIGNWRQIIETLDSFVWNPKAETLVLLKAAREALAEFSPRSLRSIYYYLVTKRLVSGGDEGGVGYDNTSKNSASRYLPRSVEPFFLVSPLGILHFAL